MQKQATYKELDYYPFGFLMPSRQFTDNQGYRFGFNGMEKDDEVKGFGNSLDFGSRSIYDGRLARFISVDPSANKIPYLSPYSYASNKPISHIDHEGEFAQLAIKYGIDVAINVTTQMLMAYMFDENVASFGEAWDEVSLIEAFGEGIVDQLGTKKLKMAVNSATQLLSYMDRVGVDGMSAKGTVAAMGVGLLEPIVGDALAKYGVKAVVKGLKKMGLDPKMITQVTGELVSYGIKKSNIDKIRKHFTKNMKNLPGNPYPKGGFAENNVMLDRLEKIAKGEMEATQTDINFMNHEMFESEMIDKYMKEGLNLQDAKDKAHEEALEYFGVKSEDLYTKEAIDAGDAQAIEEALK